MRVAVILGAAVWTGGVASPTLMRRCDAAARLWHEGGMDLLIPSGGIGRHPPAEAHVMADLLAAAGVPRSVILPEPLAVNTIATARHVAKMMVDRGPAHLILVSDAYHLPRTWLCFRALGYRARLRSTRGAQPPQSTRMAAKQTLREVAALPLTVWRLVRLRAHTKKATGG